LDPVPQQSATIDDGDEKRASPKEIALFVVRAVRENLALSLLVMFVVGALGISIAAALPKTYDATCKIFIQDGSALTGAIASGRDRGNIDVARGLQEFILAHDNLQAIVREAKLVQRWSRTRPWPMALKDRAMEYLMGPPDPQWMERAFMEMLAMSITAAKDGESVRINAQWRDPESAYDIARLVQRNFLAARAAHDHGPLQRAIPFLEQELQEADQEIEKAVSRVTAVRLSASGEVVTVDSPATAGATPGNQPSAEMQSLSRRLSEVRRQQRSLTEPRRAKVAELKMQLIEMRASYSDDHPLIRQQEARIATLTAEPPELAQLHEEEIKIINALSSRGAKDPGKTKEAAKPLAENPEVAMAQARLGTALRKSDEITARLESARIELAIAMADFKHRYVVIEEPEIPSAPLKAKKTPLFYGAAVLAALLLGALAAALREYRRGRLVEVWQVRQLGLELLGEIELK
jgi:uncharacterized protein involved in exopolysaccharide biosynthesis